MKDLFQCVMDREQFQAFCVDVPFSHCPTDDGVIITGHRMGGPVDYEHWITDDEVIITRPHPGNCRDTSLLEAWIQGDNIWIGTGFLRRWRVD